MASAQAIAVHTVFFLVTISTVSVASPHCSSALIYSTAVLHPCPACESKCMRIQADDEL